MQALPTSNGSVPESHEGYWEPNAHLLTVGARVRIRVSPECNLGCPNGCVGHHQWFTSGMTGEIVMVNGATSGLWCPSCNGEWDDNLLALAGHRFGVLADELPDEAPDFVTGGWFAAVELEPLDRPEGA